MYNIYIFTFILYFHLICLVICNFNVILLIAPDDGFWARVNVIPHFPLIYHCYTWCLTTDVRLMGRFLAPPTQVINIMLIKWQYKIQNTNKHLKIVCYVMHTNNDTDGYSTRNKNRHVGLYSHLDIMNTGIDRKAILK